MANKYQGRHTIALGGADYTLEYDWNAIATAQSDFGETALDDFGKKPEPKVIAGLMAIGLRKHHPEMTAERIMEISPPLILAVKAISDALLLAYFGPQAKPAEASGETASEEKKTTE